MAYGYSGTPAVGSNLGVGLSSPAGFAANYTAGTTLPVEPTLPDWLPTDANSQNGELMDQYNSVTNFGANKAARAIDRTAAINKTMGLQSANNAAMDYTNRIMQAGGTALASGAVKAQAMMPVLRDQAATQERKQMMLMDARKTAASMRQNLAGALNQSRNQYLGMLAGTYTTMRGQNVQYNLTGSAAGAGGASIDAGSGPMLPGGAMNYRPGYIPNAGPITPSSGWAGASGGNVLLDPTIPFHAASAGSYAGGGRPRG